MAFSTKMAEMKILKDTSTKDWRNCNTITKVQMIFDRNTQFTSVDVKIVKLLLSKSGPTISCGLRNCSMELFGFKTRLRLVKDSCSWHSQEICLRNGLTFLVDVLVVK